MGEEGRGLSGGSGGGSGRDLEAFDWDTWIASFCAQSGWTWPEVESLTIPQAAALGKAWRKTPPIPAVVGALLQAFGAKNDDDPEEQEMSAEERQKFEVALREQMVRARAAGVIVPDAYLMELAPHG